jgi:HEAT repeat protein
MRTGAGFLPALILLLISGTAFAESLSELRAQFEREKGAPYQTRQVTVQKIADLKSEAAARFLIKVVEEDADRTMRSNTIYRVAQIPLPIAYRAVLRFFENPDLRSSAFSGLVSYRSEDLPEKLIEQVRATMDQGLRSNLIRYFGKKKDERLIPEARQFLSDFPKGTSSLVSPLTQYPSVEAARILVRIYDDNRQSDRDRIPKFFAGAEDEVL